MVFYSKYKKNIKIEQEKQCVFFIDFKKSLTKFSLSESHPKILRYCWLVYNYWYPWWMKVVKGKVFLPFCPVPTKRPTILVYGHCQCYQRSDWNKRFSVLNHFALLATYLIICLSASAFLVSSEATGNRLTTPFDGGDFWGPLAECGYQLQINQWVWRWRFCMISLCVHSL